MNTESTPAPREDLISLYVILYPVHPIAEEHRMGIDAPLHLPLGVFHLSLHLLLLPL